MEIQLIRHGKPATATNPRISSQGFKQWVSAYDSAELHTSSLPPSVMRHALTHHFIISSDLPRAITSATLCLGRRPDLIHQQYREMAIPCFQCPGVFKAYTWLFMFRMAWFAGASGDVESVQQAKLRAKQCALQLISLAKEHQQIAVFGHGLMNRYISKALQQLGWQSKTQGKQYWASTQLTY